MCAFPDKLPASSLVSFVSRKGTWDLCLPCVAALSASIQLLKAESDRLIDLASLSEPKGYFNAHWALTASAPSDVLW